MNDGEWDEVTELREAAAASAARITELEQLAADILNTFAPTGDGHRARVGQVTIARWKARLDSTT